MWVDDKAKIMQSHFQTKGGVEVEAELAKIFDYFLILCGTMYNVKQEENFY